MIFFRVFFLFLAFVFPIALYAREVTVTVEDADLEIPLDGASIHSSDNVDYTTDGRGSVKITVPDGRQVLLTVRYPGYGTERAVVPLEAATVRVAMTLSGGVLESRELVIEASVPSTSETKRGRSVAVSGDTLSRTAEIGFIEDVMTSIKLLPGVGYSGMFDAQPSIRGGDPGDMTAAMDGFYIENPYHWGGAYSIFVPQMVETARLSHGVFSARYGHTISGLLEITSKKPSPSETELSVGISTSETNINLALPLGNKNRGGIMAMGKVTYWDPFIALMQGISRSIPELDAVNAITTAPYIRDFAVTAGYRFGPDLELSATAFWGGDGVGVSYHNHFTEAGRKRDVDLRFDWLNYRTFFITGLTWNPGSTTVLRGTAGVGYSETDLLADIDIAFEPENQDYTGPREVQIQDRLVDSVTTVQGRIDFDWNPPGDFLFAAGVQELYSFWAKNDRYRSKFVPDDPFPGSENFYPVRDLRVENIGFSTSAYTVLEYSRPASPLEAELGVRADHFYFAGRAFDIQTTPVVNPRLNLDFTVIKDRGVIDAFVFFAGTGLFSSIHDTVSYIETSNVVDNFTLRPNRSWTSVGGLEFSFLHNYSINAEFYYKHVFDRTYAIAIATKENTEVSYYFDGIGRVIGFDLMLQKLESQYWDGWLAYSFTWAQYREPQATSWRENWYFPDFQRFHYVNLVLNLKPRPTFNVGFRAGFASGNPERTDNTAHVQTNKRRGFSWPVDVKFSFYRFNPAHKVRTEIYLGIENLQALVYDAQWIAESQGYTGDEEASEYTPVYEMPVPMISFGFKWTY